MLFRRFRVGILCAVFIAGGAALQGRDTGARRLVGLVESSDGVAIAGMPARSRDAVFSGESLDTSAAARALVRFRDRSQANILQDSSIRFGINAAGRPLARISSGMVMMRAVGARQPVIETAKYRVQADDPAHSIYLVGILPDQSTVVAARRGAVSIEEVQSKESYVLTAGHYVLIEPFASGLPGQQQEQNKQAPGKAAGQATAPRSPNAPPPKRAPKPVKQPWHIGSLSHGSSIALLVAAAAGAGGAAAAAGAGGGGAPASPSVP